MTGVALALFAIGLADAVSGRMTGEIASRDRLFLATGSGGVAALLGGLASGIHPFGAIATALFASLLVAAWAGARLTGRATASLAVHASVLGAIALFAPAWPDDVGGPLGRWLEASPAFGSRDPARVLLVAGLLAYLGTTANAVVRAVLDVASVDFERSSQMLRGGRVIGVIERWLIFGLAISGAATAAALIVSAKSLLRFPEISGKREALEGGQSGFSPLDAVTEYLLVGSMVSWLIALSAAALLISTSP